MSSSADQQQPPPSSSFITDWGSIVGKNVKTVDYQDAGKVIAAVDNEDAIIISSEGPHSSYNYRVPKHYVQGFNDPDLLLSEHGDSLPSRGHGPSICAQRQAVRQSCVD